LNKYRKKENYLIELAKLYPSLTSGRKNIKTYIKKLNINIKITKKYFNNKFKNI
tara:strand:- start:6209 stop:6370 length:162 start_codon:yes stop_codon:yes gene_type:complete